MTAITDIKNELNRINSETLHLIKKMESSIDVLNKQSEMIDKLCHICDEVESACYEMYEFKADCINAMGEYDAFRDEYDRFKKFLKDIYGDDVVRTLYKKFKEFNCEES